ncbi:MAG: sulfurtransferase TusA family protein [Alphaproteobacteria bacterium]|nr:sulfurtransferase TusA family protein [Alphaproteobacteria bacterium]MDE2341022.1 sulfurtransferase TusA family protein [Alphaproteobacteria bacterium]
MPSAEILVDARGLRCPWPVLRAAKAIRQSSGHETIRVIADDPMAAKELAILARERNHTIEPVDDVRGPSWLLTPNAQA